LATNFQNRPHADYIRGSAMIACCARWYFNRASNAK
jgi:hypothetical protein